MTGERTGIWTAAVALVLIGGCGDTQVDVLDKGPPTYYGDITPILARACWCCHQDGGLASTLTSRSDVEGRLDAILASMDDHTMPPGSARPSPSCASLRGPFLSDADIATFHAWVDAGRLAGDPANATAVPPVCGRLEGPTQHLDNGGYMAEGAQQVESRCFIVDPGLSTDRFLTGAHFEPGSPAVRSVTLHRAPALATAGTSFDCPLEGGMVPRYDLSAWFPGAEDDVASAGSGHPVPAGTLFLMRVQYDTALSPSSLPAQVTTSVDLAWADSVERQGTWVSLTDQTMDLDPGQASVSDEAPGTLTGPTHIERLLLLMYDHGQSGRIDVTTPAGGTTCLLDAPTWDPRWIGAYELASPLDAGGGMVTVHCAFDTRGATSPVMWGDPPANDACVGALYMTRP